MREKVRDLLEKKQQELEKLKRVEQEKVLNTFIKEMYEKEYAPDVFDNSEYPNYDEEQKRRYKKVPLRLTEEEYDQFRSLQIQIDNLKCNHQSYKDQFLFLDYKGFAETALRLIAYLTWAVGLIIAYGLHYEGGWMTSLTIGFIAFQSGLIWYAFGELLHIARSMKKQ